MSWLYILIFIGSCFLITIAGDLLVRASSRITRALGWKEFVVAFFSISFAASIPELFVGLSSAFHKIPQLSFGNILGASVIHFTLAIAIATLILKGIEVKSRTVQTSTAFTSIIAILPLILILDGVLSRTDGLLLILTFFFYIFWLFSKKERFIKVYAENKVPLPIIEKIKNLLKDLGLLALGMILLILSAEGIVRGASFFARTLHLPLSFMGILIVATGTALPETYFSIKAAKRGESWMSLGNLMGSTIITTSLILGIVALICPIKVADFSPFVIAGVFLFISSMFFLLFIRTGQKITKKEALILLGIYILFIVFQLLIK